MVFSLYPTEYALLRHLFARCTNLRFLTLQLSQIHLGTPRLLDLIIKFFIPVTTHLVIVYQLSPGAAYQLPVTASVLTRILSNATTTLKTLIFEIDHLILNEPHADSKRGWLEQGIQELYLHKCGNSVESIKSWEWL